MFRFKRQSIVDQVSSSLKNPTEWSEPEVVEKPQQSIADQVSSSLKDPASFSDSEVIEQIHSDSDKEESQKSPVQPQDDLPSLEECLYGSTTRRGPFIPDDGDSSESDNGSAAFDSIDDILLNSRWSKDSDVGTDYHDIDIAVLRKLCSQGSGIPEEEGPISNSNAKRGICHRGVAWRVLLEQLPLKDIHSAWPKALPPKRKLYRELVEKYLEDAIDPGNCLKGESHWEQSLRMNGSKNSLNDSSSNGTNGDKNVLGDNSKQEENCNTNDLDSSEHIRATEDIYDVFPPGSKYKELWRKSGITLNQGESAAAIRMNRLRVPKELLGDDGGDKNEQASLPKGEDESENEQNDDADAADATDAADAAGAAGATDKTDVTEKDDSDGTSSSSESRRDDLFAQFCKDAKLLSEIRKDVVRTNPHLRFYLETRNKLGIRRHAALERVLFVWAKLNGNLYVQGMNEIVGTIYYVLAMDPTASSSTSIDSINAKEHFWADHAEADTYFLFDSLLNTMEVRDVFVADLDHDSLSGLHARIKNIEMLLKEHDPEIFNHLKVSLGLDSSFYAIRWLTTLLSREFRLPDTIRLWDSMLASTHKENFLRYVCASMVMAIRDRLLRGDFGTCLKLLQNYPCGEIGMDELLESSRALWMYETQISLACQKGGIPLRKALNMISPPDSVIMAFGRRGGKPIKISEQIRNVASTTVAPPTVAVNTNMGRFMGRAKQLWGRITPTKEKKIMDVENLDLNKINSSDENDNGGSEEWDLIDSIIEGKTEFVVGSMRSAISSISDKDTSTDSKDFATPPTTPTSSPQRTFNFKAADSLDDDDNIVDDFSNNDNSFDQDDRDGGSSNSGIWNRMRGSN